LSSLFGLDPVRGSLPVEGELVPLAGVDEALAQYSTRAALDRPELRVLDAERRAQELRAETFRRSRIPNPTISLFAQKDGIDERVLGVGVAFPLPLPGNVGRTYVGEIAESEALARRARSERAAAERQLRLEIAIAAQAFASRAKEVQAFSPEVVAQAEASLVSLAEEVESGRLALRDAVLAEQSLVELLRSNIEARREWCLASLSLARALGMPLEGGSP
jgi:cobalt-zinc-cadmium efflux system outer membrane protein